MICSEYLDATLCCELIECTHLLSVSTEVEDLDHLLDVLPGYYFSTNISNL